MLPLSTILRHSIPRPATRHSLLNSTKASHHRRTIPNNPHRSITPHSQCQHRSTHLPQLLTNTANILSRTHQSNTWLLPNNTRNHMQLRPTQHHSLPRRRNRKLNIQFLKPPCSTLLSLYPRPRRVTHQFNSRHTALFHTTTLRGEPLHQSRSKHMVRHQPKHRILPTFPSRHTMLRITNSRQAGVSAIRTPRSQQRTSHYISISASSKFKAQ